MGKISTSPRYGIEITGTDPFFFGELEVVNLKNLEKLRYF